MKTIVLQSFRDHDVPPWISRCVDSVRAWAARSGYDYRLYGDSSFDLCGRDYLAQVNGGKPAILDLVRLELMRELLREEFDRAIWFDADIFIFAPELFAIDVTEGYALCKEVWIAGEFYHQRVVNNAVTVFTKHQPDLDFIIAATRHVAAHRVMDSNYQLGTWLLTGLERSLRFPLVRTVGTFSPVMLHAIVSDDEPMLRYNAAAFGDRVFAGHLCLSQSALYSDALAVAVIDKLVATHGDVVNRYLPAEPCTTPLGEWILSGPQWPKPLRSKAGQMRDRIRMQARRLRRTVTRFMQKAY